VRHGPSCSHHRDTAFPPAPSRRRGPKATTDPRPAPKVGVRSPVPIRALRDSARSADFDSVRAPPHGAAAACGAGLDGLAPRTLTRLPPPRSPLLLALRAAGRGAFGPAAQTKDREGPHRRTVGGRSWQAPLCTEYGGGCFSNGAGGSASAEACRTRGGGLALWPGDITTPTVRHVTRCRGLVARSQVCRGYGGARQAVTAARGHVG
jgi:hypothetical protein